MKKILSSIPVLSGCLLYRIYLNSGNNVKCSLTDHNAKSWDEDWDHRKRCESIANNTSLSDERPTAVRHVILVRHGHYHKATDDDSKVLTTIGRRQAAITGKRLKALNIKFNRITTSTMIRAQQTADIISEHVQNVSLSECSLLREGAPYFPDPCLKPEWTPGRETFFQDNPRIEGAFRKYIHRATPSQKEDSYDLLVCHGNVIRYFVCRGLQFPPQGWIRMRERHCGITWLTIEPDGQVTLREFGNTGHLPPELLTIE